MPGTKYPRIFTWGRFRSRQTDAVFHVYCAHTDHQSAEARLSAAQQITEHMRAVTRDGPALLMGDLNAGADSPENGAYWKLLKRACPDDWTWQDLLQQHSAQKIDYILHTRHWRRIDGRVLRPRPAEQRLSDHDPIVCRLALEVR